MRVLVVYASRYGSTEGIAERIADVINRSGNQAAAVPAGKAGVLDGYDAYVVGSALYEGSWLRAGRAFVKSHAAALNAKPVWLFSSGPIGTKKFDEKGHDVREAATPKDLAELADLVHPRGHRVFFGAFHAAGLNLFDRMICSLPALKGLMTDGDFRDWADIEAWTVGILKALTPAPVPVG
jgi:menaquinone-dependent protoporphyrinogen oxidase